MQVSCNMTTGPTHRLVLSICGLSLRNLNVCLVRTIYEKLASAFTEELAVLYRQRVDEISPNIRYCAYNIGE